METTKCLFVAGLAVIGVFDIGQCENRSPFPELLPMESTSVRVITGGPLV